MHFNDNHTTTDDDMIVGTVYSVCYLEMLYWPDGCDYAGWLSMDRFPYPEDAAGAIGESIFWLRQFSEILKVNRSEIDELVKQQGAVAMSRFLRSILAVGKPVLQARA